MGTKGEKAVLPVLTEASGKIKAYFTDQLLNPSHSKKKSAQIAGYSAGTQPTNIENGQLALSIRADILAASKAHNLTPDDCMKVLGEIVRDKEETGATRIKAIERTSKMVGYEAPLQLESKETKEDITTFMAVVKSEKVSISSVINSINTE